MSCVHVFSSYTNSPKFKPSLIKDVGEEVSLYSSSFANCSKAFVNFHIRVVGFFTPFAALVASAFQKLGLFRLFNS